MQKKTRGLTSRLAPASIDQIATEVNVDNDGVVLEMRANVAIRAGKVGRGSAPSGGVGLLAGDVARDGISGKLPYANAGGSPFDGHDAAAGGVEGGAKRGVGFFDATARVLVDAVIAIVLQRGARLLALDTHGAIVCGVERHGVAVGALVDGLHDVNFAVLRPVERVGKPQCWPGATGVRRVLDVENEEAAVVRLLGFKTHGEAARGCVGLAAGTDSGVDAEDGRARSGVGEVLYLFVSFESPQQSCRMQEATHAVKSLFFRHVMHEALG